MNRRTLHIAGSILSLVAGLLGFYRAYAQDSTALRFEHIDSRRGLSHNSVYVTYQDSQGFLWIGTSDGLNRFDGYEFITYRHLADDSTSLQGRSVRAIQEGHSGSLWVGTESGLDRLDRMSRRFHRYLSEGTTDLVRDRVGNLWAATMSGRVFRYDRKTDSFVLYHTYDERRSFFSPIALDTSGIPLIVGREIDRDAARVAAYRYDVSRDRFEEVLSFKPTPDRHRPPQIHAGPSGTIWLSGVDDSIDSATAFRFRRVPALPTSTIVNRVAEDHDGILWIGTDGDGLFRYDPSEDAPQQHRLGAGAASWLNNNVQDLFVDRTGVLWVGTLGGVYRLDPHRKQFYHMGHRDGTTGEAALQWVTSVFEDDDGLLWAGTLGSGLLRIDRGRGSIESYLNREGDAHSMSSDLVWGIRKDGGGSLWIAADHGINILDRLTGRFSRLNIGTHDLTTEHNGVMWAGTSRTLYEIDVTSRRVIRQLILPTESISETNAILLDREGRLWVSQEGLFLCDLKAAGCALYEPTAQDSLGLPRTSIWSIHEDVDGILWLGTRDGLFRVDTEHGRIYRQLGATKLPGSDVYSILEDGRERLWMGTSRGLARFDKRTGAVRVFGISDGVVNSEFNRRAAFESPRGEFFFGGREGITRFFPDAIRDNPFTPPIALTRFHKTGPGGAILFDPVGVMREGLLLRPGEHEFTFEFAALNFTSPEMNRYAYMLEGFDRDWVQAGDRRFARYVGVPPGSYTFRVRGSNNDGLWNEEGASMAVTVFPPFWQTAWFRLLGAAAVIALLFGAHRYRVNRLLEVEHLRFRIASDLHDDVGSKLSSVALIGEMVTQRADLPERERRQLTEMTSVARQMVEDLRDIVWMVSPGRDTLDNLASKMHQTADSMLNGTSYAIHLPADGFSDGLEMERRRHLFLMYKEVLHNVQRHARSEHVDIRLETRNGVLTLDVRDDGIGFDPASIQPGSGLQNLQERARLLGGSVTVESRPGTGTAIRITAQII